MALLENIKTLASFGKAKKAKADPYRREGQDPDANDQLRSLRIK